MSSQDQASRVLSPVPNRSVCIISHVPSYYFGGSAVQLWGIGKGLASRGYRVSFLSPDPLKGDGLEIEGLKCFRFPFDLTVRRRAILMMPFTTLRIFQLLFKGRSSIYMLTRQDKPGYLAGIVALFCRIFRRRFVYRVAHLWELNAFERRKPILSWRRLPEEFNKALYRFGLRNARAVVCNSEEQATILRRILIKSRIHVIRNGQTIPTIEPHSNDKLVFSLARMDKIKRPELFVELAKLLPQYSFVLAGAGPLERMISLEASRVPNITFLGPVSNDMKEHYFRRAAVFVNSSVAEGFPNTLIEAGIFRVPYVATYDPDDVICRYNIGYHVTDVEGMRDSITALLEDPEKHHQISENIRLYVEEHHDISKTVEGYFLILEKIYRDAG